MFLRFFLLFSFLNITLLGNNNLIISYFEDISNKFNIVQIEKKQFKPLLEKKFGFRNGAFWLKIDATNIKKKEVLEFLDARIDYVWFYRNDGTLIATMGDMLPFNNRIYDDINIALPINPREVYFIKILNKSKLNLAYYVWKDEKQYLKHIMKKNLFKAFYFGAILVMIIYNFVLWIFIKDKAILYYVFFHIAFLHLMLYYNGVLAQWIFPYKAGLDSNTVLIHVSAFASILGLQFVRIFLQTRYFTPKIDLFLIIMMIYQVINSLLSIFDIAYHYNHLAYNMSVIVEAFSFIYISLYIYKSYNYKIALFFFFGWFMMIIGSISASLIMLNIMPRTDLTNIIFQIGSLFEVSLLSMGLAYRYKQNQDALLIKNEIIAKQTKFVSMGEMLQHIAHQWRQPLSEINGIVMRIDTEIYKQKIEPIKIENNLQKIENITNHLSETIDTFQKYFRSHENKKIILLSTLLEDVIKLVTTRIKKLNVDLVLDIQEDMEIVIDVSKISQILLIIINNALDALSQKEGKRIIVLRTEKQKQLLIHIEDNAGGLSDEYLEQIFNICTSQKKTGGMGIGLYIAKTLSDNMGIKLEGKNNKEGAVFTIWI